MTQNSCITKKCHPWVMTQESCVIRVPTPGQLRGQEGGLGDSPLPIHE